MIEQFRYTIQSENLQKIPSFWAYRFYSYLLEQIPANYVEDLHGQGIKPLSQYLYYDREKETSIWTVNLLNEECCYHFSNILKSLNNLSLEKGTFFCNLIENKVIENNLDLLSGSNYDDNICRIYLKSTTSFKQNNRYVIFPDERLILQSLVNNWNAFNPDFLLEDEDAFDLLLKGTRIKSYQLRSSTYPLKKTVIPGFSGWVDLSTRLSVPIKKIFDLLMRYANYSGLGVKTTLGMGGVITETV